MRASERLPPDVARAHSTWLDQIRNTRVDQLLFIDKFGCTTTMQRKHGRAPPGERVVCRVPGGHWKVLSTIAALTVRGIGASANFEGATDTDTFIVFVRDGLVPTLRPGDVFVLDNLSVHKSAHVRRLIEQPARSEPLAPPATSDTSDTRYDEAQFALMVHWNRIVSVNSIAVVFCHCPRDNVDGNGKLRG